MKNDKVTTTKDKKKNSGKNGTANSGRRSNTGASNTIASPGVIENKKARAGSGLANEGTITSYEEER